MLLIAGFMHSYSMDAARDQLVWNVQNCSSNPTLDFYSAATYDVQCFKCMDEHTRKGQLLNT